MHSHVETVLRRRALLLITSILFVLPCIGTLVVAEASLDEWLMFHHDLTHTGYSTSTAPTTNNTLWSYTTGFSVWSSPAVVDDKVYIGSGDSKVYCFDSSTGALIWSYKTGGTIYFSSPAVSDGKVYIGSSDISVGRGNVYCLNASTGSKIWSYTTGE